MTRLVWMKLLIEANAVATKVNLAIVVTANVVHSTQLNCLVAIVNTASVGGSAQGISQCANATMNVPPPSPPASLGSSQIPALSLYSGSSMEQFLYDEHRCFNCRCLLGRDPTKYCFSIKSGHYPKKDDPEAAADGKVSAAEFKALHASNIGGG